MVLQYATIAQFYEFRGLALPDPMDAAETLRLNALLQRASTRIKTAARTGRVSYASTGLPSNGTVAEGFARATSAQALWWENNGDDGSGSASNFDSVAMDGVSYSRRAGSQVATASPGASRVAPEAIEILGALGIFSTAVLH